MDPARKYPEIRGKPTQRDFDLFDTYNKLSLSNLEQLEGLDENTITTAENIVAYFADKTVGISTASEDNLKSLKKQLESATTQKASLNTNVQARAKAIFDNLHPHHSPFEELPDELRKEALTEFGGVELAKTAQTSRRLRKEIKSGPEYGRILVQKAYKLCKQQCERDLRFYDGVLINIGVSLARVGDIEGAEEILKFAYTQVDVNALYNIGRVGFALVEAYLKKGNINAAKKIAQSLKSNRTFDYRETIPLIARTQFLKGDLKGAIETIETAKEGIDPSASKEAKALDQYEFARAFAWIHENEKAMSVIDEMPPEEKVQKIIAFAEIAKSVASEGYTEKSQKLLQKANTMALELPFPDDILSVIKKTTNLENHSLLQRAYTIAKEQPRYLEKITIQLAKIGDIESANKRIQLLTPLETDGIDRVVIALFEIIKAQLKAGDIEEALKNANIPLRNVEDEPIIRGQAYLLIAEDQAKRGYIENGRRMLQKAREFEITGKTHFTSIPKILALLGDTEEAYRTVEANNNLGSWINQEGKLKGLIEIAKVQEANGDVKGKTITLEMMDKVLQEKNPYNPIEEIKALIVLASYFSGTESIYS